MKYRVELEALNALVAEQRRTNELLEQLLATKTTAEPRQKPVTHIKDKVKTPQKRQTQRRKVL